MRVLLINPTWDFPVVKKGGRHSRIWPPIALANCASLLEREGIDVKILDANAMRLSPEEVGEIAKDFNIVFLSTSSLDRWQCPNIDINILLKTLERLHKPYILGAHGTLLPREILELTGAKAVIRGEPELTVLKICKKADHKQVKGVTYRRDDGEIISNEDPSPLDLNDLPIPSYHLLPVDKYFYEVLGDHFMIFEGSRGCPYNCSYCSKKIFGKYRKKSAKNLIKEVEMAMKKYSVKRGYFIDLEFTLNRKLIEELCDHLIRKGSDFKWTCQTRLDSVDWDMLQKMKKAGCELIHYGVESGTPRMIELVNKGITIEKIEEGIELTHKAGIKTACFIMFGLPGETIEDMERTIEFAKKLNPTYASFHIWTPYPQTYLHDMVKDELTGLFPQAYTGEHSLKELNKIIKRAFLKFYLRPGYIMKRISQGDFKSIIRQIKLFRGYLNT